MKGATSRFPRANSRGIVARVRGGIGMLAVISMVSSSVAHPAVASIARGSTELMTMGSGASFAPPRGPFTSIRASAARPIGTLHVEAVAPMSHPPNLGRGARSHSEMPATWPFVGIVSRGVHRVQSVSRQAQALTLGQASSTGINRWWAYESDLIPGLGRFMVNVANRNLIVQADDFDIPHRWIAAAFRRTYNSFSQHDYVNTDQSVPSSFGNGWTNTFDAHLAVNSGANGTYGITVFDGDGARYDYTPTTSAGTTLVPPPGVHASLIPDSTMCTYYWTKPNGTEYHFRTPVTAPGKPCAVGARTVAQAGRLMNIYGRNQSSQLDLTYSWDNGNSISAANLNQIGVSIDGLTTVATLNFTTVGASCSPAVSYRLLQSVVLLNGDSTYYQYDCSGNLTEVDKPNNNGGAACALGGANCIRERYAYAAGHILTAAAGGNWSASLTNSSNLATGTTGGYVVFNPVGSGPAIANAQLVGVINPQIADGYSTSSIQPSPTGVVTFRTIYYDQSGSVTTWHDTDGHQTAYTFDSIGRVTQFSHATGSGTLTSTRTWDGDNNIASESDYRGNITNYAHDTLGDTLAIAEPAVTVLVNGQSQQIRPTTLYAYDGNFNVVAHCDPVWTATKGAEWNGTGAPTACPVSVGSTTTPGPDVYVYSDQTGHGYEPFGELTDTYAANGYHMHYTYAGGSEGGTSGNAGLDFGSPTNIVGDPVTSGGTQISPSQTFVYDAYGNIVCANKGQGFGIVQYDALGRKILAADPDDASVTNASCPKTPGLAGSTIVQRFTYFQNGQVASSQDPSEAAVGVSTTMTYDLDGNNASVTKHFGGTAGTTKRWFDADDRLVEVQQPRDATDYFAYPWMTRYFYDLTQGGTVSIGTATGLKAYGHSYKTQMYVAAGSAAAAWVDSTGATFDAVDRAVSAYDVSLLSGTPTATNTYDQNQQYGLLTTNTNGDGIGAYISYDAMSRPLTKNYSDGTPNETLSYDPAGRVAEMTLAGIGSQVTSFDSRGNPLSVTSPAIGAESAPTTISYTYAPNGWRATLGVSQGTTNAPTLFTYAYRADGKLTQQTVNWNGATNTYQYTYTAAGRRLTMSDPATGTGFSTAVARGATAVAASAPSHSVDAALTTQKPLPDIWQLLGSQRGVPAVQSPSTFLGPGASGDESIFGASSTRSGARPLEARPRAVIKETSIPSKAHPLGAVRMPLASAASFVPTSFGYNSYGQLNSETLPTGYQYSNISYDAEADVTSFTGYGDNANPSTYPTLQVRNAYTVRGELQGQHYYPVGGTTYLQGWPHFSNSNANGYSIPTSEDVASNDVLDTAWFAQDARSDYNELYDSSNTLLQAYAFTTDYAGRQTFTRWEGETSPGSYSYGTLLRAYDDENRVTSWSMLTQDPSYPTRTMSGIPIQGPNVNLKCNAPGTSLAPTRPGSSITYAYGFNGQVSVKTVNNVGVALVREQLHYDGSTPLFSTDNTGTIDNVRVGIQGIVLPNGSTTMFDRDFNGEWVLTHSATGYSAWDPPDPNLQNCAPNSPPPPTANYAPAGLPIAFANLSADTLTDGYNFFAGARTYDPESSQWTAPDPVPGTKDDPISQLPFIWNRDNPESYSDPTGLCSDPGGKGVRVCVDFYIPQASIAGFGLLFSVSGDDRGPTNFSSFDQDSFRVRVNIDFNDESKSSFQIGNTTDLNHANPKPGYDNGDLFHWTGPNDVDVEVNSSCGYCGWIRGISAITSSFHVHLDPNSGDVTITGWRSMYPAVEGYKYSNSYGPTNILIGDALGPPAFGTVVFLPHVAMNATAPDTDLNIDNIGPIPGLDPPDQSP